MDLRRILCLFKFRIFCLKYFLTSIPINLKLSKFIIFHISEIEILNISSRKFFNHKKKDYKKNYESLSEYDSINYLAYIQKI